MNNIPIEDLMQHADRLYQFALSRVKDHHVAEDLVQDCLSAGWQGIDRFNASSSLSTWLGGIMKFKIIDHFRRSERSPSDQCQDACDERDTLDTLFDAHGSWRVDPNYGLKMLTAAPDQAASQNELFDWISRCLKKLPERLHVLFTLREVDGLDVASAAAAAGVTTGSAGVLLTRSRQKLRACLQSHGITPQP
ncbi:sigma-70 family RNA polymerase sigma factor [Verrucomicrobiaceae bacterium R5-34]|nr:sigma-70 family RNA polymerase sigma factor [Verrucomicrobiaceae bacterium R5-34]